ncbi:MAG: flavodoxin [Desulfobacterium sp.]
MKAILLVTILAALMCSTVSYSKEAKKNEVEEKSSPDAPMTISEKKSLVIYFSMPETTNSDNMTTHENNSTVVIDGKVLGNTQYMAYMIQQTIGADIFRIEPVKPYPTHHGTLVDLAAKERDANARPAIAGQIENFAQYDTVFIGYPIWWSDMPMILFTLFEAYDFSGKTIVPFSTHGGSRFAGTPEMIRQLEPKAKMLEGLTVSRNRIQKASQQIVDWVNGLDL